MDGCPDNELENPPYLPGAFFPPPRAAVLSEGPMAQPPREGQGNPGRKVGLGRHQPGSADRGPRRWPGPSRGEVSRAQGQEGERPEVGQEQVGGQSAVCSGRPQPPPLPVLGRGEIPPLPRGLLGRGGTRGQAEAPQTETACFSSRGGRRDPAGRDCLCLQPPVPLHALQPAQPVRPHGSPGVPQVRAVLTAAPRPGGGPGGEHTETQREPGGTPVLPVTHSPCRAAPRFGPDPRPPDLGPFSGSLPALPPSFAPT